VSAHKLVTAALVTAGLGAAATPAAAADWRNIRQEVRGAQFIGLNAWGLPALHNAVRALQQLLPVSLNVEFGFGVDYGISPQSLWLYNNGFAGYDLGFAGFEMTQANYQYIAHARVDDTAGTLLNRAVVHTWSPGEGYGEVYDSGQQPYWAQYSQPLRCRWLPGVQRSFGLNTPAGWVGVNGTVSISVCHGIYVAAVPVGGIKAEVTAQPDIWAHLGGSVPGGGWLTGHVDISGDSSAELRVQAGEIRGNQVCASARGFAELLDVGEAAVAIPGRYLLNEPGFDHRVGFDRTLGCHELW
jgi:hypothetical protein